MSSFLFFLVNFIHTVSCCEKHQDNEQATNQATIDERLFEIINFDKYYKIYSMIEI